MTLLQKIADAEIELRKTTRRVSKETDPVKKAKLMWELAWSSKLRDLEDIRPAGGFSELRIEVAPARVRVRHEKKEKRVPDAIPDHMIPLKQPGYFWNPQDQTLYSNKVSGVLRPLTIAKAVNIGGRDIPRGFQISVQGHSRRLPLEWLKTLKPKRK